MFIFHQTSKHPFIGLFSGTTLVSRHQNGKISLNLNEGRDDGVALTSAGPYKNHCTSLQIVNHATTASLSLSGHMLFLTLNQECQTTEGRFIFHQWLMFKGGSCG